MRLELDGRRPATSDKIVRMPPPVQLADDDLELAEEACRANAARCRREGAIEHAATWDRLADKIARARTPRWPSEA